MKIKRGVHQDGKARREREAKLNRVSVRCLGPGAEHNFMSIDRCTRRICPKCTVIIEKLSNTSYLKQVYTITPNGVTINDGGQ